MMPDAQIFISYARTDSQFVLRLATALRGTGLSVWIDQHNLTAGARWDQAIERALRASRTVLVVLSKNATVSQNVMDEAAFALDEGKHVVPVIYRECTVPLRLRRLQSIDFASVAFDVACARLVQELTTSFEPPPTRGEHIPGTRVDSDAIAPTNHAVGHHDQDATLRDNARTRRNDRHWSRTWIAGGLVLAVALVLLIWLYGAALWAEPRLKEALRSVGKGLAVAGTLTSASFLVLAAVSRRKVTGWLTRLGPRDSVFPVPTPIWMVTVLGFAAWLLGAQSRSPGGGRQEYLDPYAFRCDSYDSAACKQIDVIENGFRLRSVGATIYMWSDRVFVDTLAHATATIEYDVRLSEVDQEVILALSADRRKYNEGSVEATTITASAIDRRLILRKQLFDDFLGSRQITPWPVDEWVHVEVTVSAAQQIAVTIDRRREVFDIKSADVPKRAYLGFLMWDDFPKDGKPRRGTVWFRNIRITKPS